MPIFMKFDGVDGDVVSGRGETISDFAILKPLDGHPGGANMLFGDGSVRDISPYDAIQVNPPSWGLDRIDQRAPDGPFFAYGDDFLGGVEVSPPSPGAIRLEMIYVPIDAPDVGGLVVPDIEAKGVVMTAGFLF